MSSPARWPWMVGTTTKPRIAAMARQPHHAHHEAEDEAFLLVELHQSTLCTTACGGGLMKNCAIG